VPIDFDFMMADLDAQRTKIKQLYVKRKKGDLTEKAFQRRLSGETIELYRAVIQKRMAKDETILKSITRSAPSFSGRSRC